MTNETTAAVPVIETRNLTKIYSTGGRETRALAGVDLTLSRGDFVAVMGASGSGKSSLLHLIAGLTRPTSGSVSLEGIDPFGITDGALTRLRRRRVGLVFQNFNLIPHLTARENIVLPSLAEGIGRRESFRRADELAETLGIADRLDRRPETLSGGEQQRVALARALTMDPALLLADEPTGNLDSVNSRLICQIFDRLCRKEDRTILLVTHEPAVAAWSKRLLVLRDGQIIADRPTSDFHDAHHLAAAYQEIVEGAAAGKEEKGGTP